MRVGGGLVFYSASDQTWKWRFRKADAVHRRLWAQICRSYARKPFLVQSDSLKIDVPAKIFSQSEAIPIRAYLNPDQFGRGNERLVYALMKDKSSGEVSRVQMRIDERLPFHYQATLPPQPAGVYDLSIETPV